MHGRDLEDKKKLEEGLREKAARKGPSKVLTEIEGFNFIRDKVDIKTDNRTGI